MKRNTCIATLLLISLCLLPSCKKEEAQDNAKPAEAAEVKPSAQDEAKADNAAKPADEAKAEDAAKPAADVAQAGHALFQEKSGMLEKLTKSDKYAIASDVKWVDTKWANESSKSGTSDLKVAAGKDIVKEYSAFRKSDCFLRESKTAPNGTEVQLIYCTSKVFKDVDRSLEDDALYSALWKAQYDYEIELVEKGVNTELPEMEDILSINLAIISPDDKTARVFSIDAENNHAKFNNDYEMGLQILDIKPISFLDTTALQIKVLSTAEELLSDTECDAPFGCEVFAKNYAVNSTIFAGPKYRKVNDWLEASFKETTDPRECEPLLDANEEPMKDKDDNMYVADIKNCPHFEFEDFHCQKTTFDGSSFNDSDIECK